MPVWGVVLCAYLKVSACGVRSCGLRHGRHGLCQPMNGAVPPRLALGTESG
jgi:hypothetical protein